MFNNLEMKYGVGALLYSPALNHKIADAVVQGSLGDRYSLALCLEDTIPLDKVELAEQQIGKTMRQISTAAQNTSIYLPKIFIRVREPGQIGRIYESIKDCQTLLTGFVFPKYTVSNGDAYNREIIKINEKSKKRIYMMPILESCDIIELNCRSQTLGKIKEQIDSVAEYVLNVRVGGNDFSNAFAVRRHYDETIYDILPVARLLGDILTVFSGEYVVSGPVWEYFSSEGDQWENGLRKELKLDKLNGFVGKTVIHPKQIPIVNEMLKVSNKDYEDAKVVLNWDSDSIQVGKSYKGERMNEVRTHYNWAKKTVILSELYGII